MTKLYSIYCIIFLFNILKFLFSNVHIYKKWKNSYIYNIYYRRLFRYENNNNLWLLETHTFTTNTTWFSGIVILMTDLIILFTYAYVLYIYYIHTFKYIQYIHAEKNLQYFEYFYFFYVYYIYIFFFLQSECACWKIREEYWTIQNESMILTIAGKLQFSDIQYFDFCDEVNSISLSQFCLEVPKLRQLSFPTPNHHHGHILRWSDNILTERYTEHSRSHPFLRKFFRM